MFFRSQNNSDKSFITLKAFSEVEKESDIMQKFLFTYLKIL